MSIETDIKRMEEITAKLKDNQTPLEEAIKLFEEGVGIADALEKQLASMERKVEILLTPLEDKESTEPHLESFGAAQRD
ncbi:MAG: exodeoxyribonuclease VII small subunit [Sphaerochaetaceae bacterium]